MHFSLGLSDVTNPIVRETTSQDRIAACQSCNVTHVDNYVTYSPDSDTSGFNKTWDSGLPVQFGSISFFATLTRYPGVTSANRLITAALDAKLTELGRDHSHVKPLHDH